MKAVRNFSIAATLTGFFLLHFCIHTTHAQVVINELMPHPAGGSTDQVFQSMFNSTPSSGHEWVELYNTDPCQPVDISCWTIGGMDGTSNGGGFSFPNGTIIPPLGFLVIGGPNAPNVDFNLNAAAYNPASGWLWTSGATRWHLPNGDGWLVLYDNTGAAVDGVYWTFSSNDPTKISTDATYDGTPQQGANCGGAVLASAETVFNGGGMEYLGLATVAGQSYERTQDGGATWALTASPTAKACNGICVTSNSFTITYAMVTETCLGDNNGSIAITAVNGGVGPYTYAWSNASTSNAISNLSPGTYTVTITDQTAGCQFDTTFTLPAGPNCASCPNPWIVNTASTPNTVCNGTSTPCTTPGAVVINEVMPRPAGGSTDQVFQSMFNSTPAYGHEWVELYNPSPCNPIDLSCYTIGGMDGTSNGGAYSFPAGTILPPLGFLVVGGPNAPNVDVNLNAVSAGNLWTSGATRWHLPNGDGWLLLYNPAGTPVNGVYWTFAGNDPNKITSDATYDGTPVQGSNCGGATLASAETAYNAGVMSYVPFVTADGQSFARDVDGGTTWLSGAPTSGACNAACATPGGGTSTCDGTATATPTNGTAPYTYLWDAAAGSQTTQTATALCAGTYCVLITDAQACTETVCVTVTDNAANVTPTFNAVAPICSGATLSALPTTSTNGITGTWSPALNNTATTTYTFTPTAGQCATTTTLTITVNPNVTPTFNAVAPICSGATLSALPTTSTNGITGTWSPALNNTATTTYTFTPTAGQCATTTTLTITVNPNVTPTFNAVAPICSGATLTALPTTSTNGITGTWSPALNNTATTTYTFTPTAGQCATTSTLTITVNPNVTPTFNAVAPICAGSAIAALPTTSTNGITGTWSPALNNTATTTYTFTPTAGQCATTTTLTITVHPNFSSVQNITQCSGLSYTFPDGTTYVNITTNQTYVSVLNAVTGCDSAITTNITVVSGFSINENVSICAGSNYTFPDGTIHNTILANETYVSNLLSSGGCDSTVTTNLVVNPVYAINENVNVCEGTSYTFPDGFSAVISGNLNHVSNLLSVSGCDSVITTQVVMIPITTTTVNPTVCANTNFTFPDGTSQVVNASLTQVSTLTSSQGCDSLVTTNLTVIPSQQQVQNITLCAGSSYTFPDGVTHTNIQANEQYQSNFTSAQGCDSIWITNITVSPLPSVNAGTDFSVCEGNAVVLNASGATSYTWDQGMVNGVPSVLAPGTYVFTVTGTTAAGCQATDAVQVIVHPSPVPQITANITNGCAPLNVLFTATGVGAGGAFDWNFGNGSSGSGNPVATTYSLSGLYDVSLTYTDANGCSAFVTATDFIEVFPTPTADFSFTPQQPDVLNPEVVFQNNSNGASNYVWYFGDSTQSTEISPTHVYPGAAGSYVVTLVASNGGCTDSVQLVVTIQDIVLFYVPNAFTPDADGKNDIFIPVFSSGIDPEDYHLMIFNRWGELIFETHATTQGWDGNHKGQGPVKDDVYVWKIEFKESMSAKRQVLYGHVTLVK